MSEITVEIVVSGVVQGVGFRAWTQRTGTSLGLRGVVRNRRDGTVQAVVHGPSERVDALVQACRAGPQGARVTSVVRREMPDDALPEVKGMEIGDDG
jgi:acylphosphatase